MLDQDTMFCYGILLKKSQNNKELRKNLKKIIERTTDVSKLKYISDIIIYLLNNISEEIGKNEILNELDKIKKVYFNKNE